MSSRNWSKWFEIPVSDYERAKTFYETIFDIKLEDMDAGPVKMGIFPHEGNPGGGAIAHFPMMYFPGDQGVTLYLNADPDLKTVLDRVEAAGGELILTKKQISEEHGYMALFKDTEGNRLALHSEE